MVEILKPLTDFAVGSLSIDCCINPLIHNSNSLKVWVALAQSITEAQILINMKTHKKMLTWPVLAMRDIEVVCEINYRHRLDNSYNRACNASFFSTSLN